MNFFKHFKKLDWFLIAAAFLLTLIGLLSLYSSSLSRDFENFYKQIVFFCLAVFLMFLFSFFDYRTIKSNPYLILILYFFSCLALAGLFFFADEIRGIRSWYTIGPVSVNPIEYTKIALLFLLASYFSSRHIEMYRLKHILVSGFYFLIPSLLILFQPDLGSILIIICLWLGILIISGIKLKHFLILIICGIIIFSLSWSFVFKDYQKERIYSFIEPQLEPLGMGWSQNQSKIAIGSGQLFGQGIGQGSQTQYGFLPEPQTDFIFAAIAEETGFFGVIVLLFLYLIVLFRVFHIAVISQNNFCRLFAVGTAILFASQIFINIGMNLGILPIIGIPLPFISYGGNNLILNFILIGILENIYSQKSKSPEL